MSVAQFVGQLAEAIEVDEDKVGADTRFDALENWDSLAALSTIVMCYVEYDVEVSGDELVACQTIGDLYGLVSQKAAAAGS